MTPPITRREQVRRRLVVALDRLGEHVLDREAAAATLVDAIAEIVELRDDRFVAVVCNCYGPKRAKPAVLDTEHATHVLFQSREIAERTAKRWNVDVPEGQRHNPLYITHRVQA